MTPLEAMQAVGQLLRVHQVTPAARILLLRRQPRHQTLHDLERALTARLDHLALVLGIRIAEGLVKLRRDVALRGAGLGHTRERTDARQRSVRRRGHGRLRNDWRRGILRSGRGAFDDHGLGGRGPGWLQLGRRERLVFIDERRRRRGRAHVGGTRIRSTRIKSTRVKGTVEVERGDDQDTGDHQAHHQRATIHGAACSRRS